MSLYLLVHGACHGAWCWDNVSHLLRDLGHDVIAPDLPAHGNDRTPIAGATLDAYVDRLADLLNVRNESAIVVGHSMGGICATGVAERLPEKIKALVYLTAYAPIDGDSVMSLLAADSTSTMGVSVEPVHGGAALVVRDDQVIPMFYNDCDPGDAEWAKSMLVPEPATPMAQPVRLTARSGVIPRSYIGCSSDVVISLAYQRQLAARAGCVWQTEIDSGHSPFISRPDVLARCLVDR